jgi:hypothetical protein
MRRLRFAALAVFAGLAGCGDTLYPVKGQLVWPDGKPALELAGSQVMFESAEHHSVSRSVVQDDATFRLTTERPGDGVPPGLHHVYIVESRSAGGEGEAAPPARIDKRFGRPESSGLEVTVSSELSSVVLKVERPPGR